MTGLDKEVSCSQRPAWSAVPGALHPGRVFLPPRPPLCCPDTVIRHMRTFVSDSQGGGPGTETLLFPPRWVKQESEISKESQDMDSRPKLDLGFKEGQTIKLSIGVSVVPPSVRLRVVSAAFPLTFLFPSFLEHYNQERRRF